ncbi:hypothetical protein [Pyxidicoccus xibeiensis]|uniref:hypothetical protein n=1 Tax=Pyxidicoccus xibeiensis TaxID=2906759 RepID=UPI0020A70529|nr:hypothetical protein [Pyxidicoccus xibeiensis]MCP3137804.1 hypothetical protein [Pyxidicoccus xibeiensis]
MTYFQSPAVRARGWVRAVTHLHLGALLCVLLSACHEAPKHSCEAGCEVPPVSLDHTFDRGTLSHGTTSRPGWGGLKTRLSGGRVYVLETSRDSAGGTTRRLVAYSPEARELWAREAQPREHFSDFTVHPSGELTLGVERIDAERGGYDLVRLSAEGQVLARQPLPEAATLPPGDLGADLPAQPFRMKSRYVHALADGWLRTEARGEGLVVAFLSRVDEPDEAPDRPSPYLVSGVMALGWSGTDYSEQWTRLVDGRHRVEPAAWAYDEFRWREAPLRTLLAVDGDGGVVVGRTWNTLRCLASSETFQDVTRLDCLTGEDVASPMDTEYQPFAFTAFSALGEREGTHPFVPASVAEFVVFDMAVKNGEVALAGTAVRQDARGVIHYYPPFPGADSRMAPYDGYVAVLGRRTGALRFERYVAGERADHLSALRWTSEGLLVAGATGWDRWGGGMSISRGAGPLLALVSEDGARVRVQRVPLDGGERHFHLLGVDVEGSHVVAVGLAEAPMTHSGDGDHRENMTFGGLTLKLR